MMCNFYQNHVEKVVDFATKRRKSLLFEKMHHFFAPNKLDAKR